MKFLQTISDSIYNPEFYKKLKDIRIRQSVSYFFKLSIILAVFSVIPFIPLINNILHSNAITKIGDTYPRELEIKIVNGIVSTNVTEPYSIQYTESTSTTNIMVFDTKTDFNPAQFDAYKTGIIVKKSFVAVQDNNQNIKVYQLDQFHNLTINYANVQSWLRALQSILVALTPVFVILLYVGFMIVFAVKLVYLFIAALLIMLATYLIKRPRSYMKSYQVGIHAMTLGLLLQVLFGILHIATFYLSFTIVLLVIVILNFYNMSEHKSDEPLPAEHV